ncbi:MAG: cobalamin biosynthesis protein [Pseudomonadota bacterium]
MAGDAVIAAGFGFRASATAESLADAFQKAGGGATMVATVAEKADQPAFIDFADDIGISVRAIAPETLQTQTTRTNSAVSLKAHGVGSVAEAAALAAAGPGARLLGARAVSSDGMATCAIAKGAEA